MGEGQRVGLFAGSGVGKSTLMGQIARNTEAEVNVICLIGERGREVRRVHRGLAGRRGPDALGGGLRHLRRAQPGAPQAPFVATAIAE